MCQHATVEVHTSWESCFVFLNEGRFVNAFTTLGNPFDLGDTINRSYYYCGSKATVQGGCMMMLRCTPIFAVGFEPLYSPLTRVTLHLTDKYVLGDLFGAA